MTWQRKWIDGRMQRVYEAKPEVTLPPFLFDKQRAQCKRCARYSSDVTLSNMKGGTVVDFCERTAPDVMGRACSFERLPGGRCGPEAKRFVERIE